MKKLLFPFVLLLCFFSDSKAQWFDTITTKVQLNAEPPHTLMAWGWKGCQYISNITVQALGDTANTQEVRIYFKCLCSALPILPFDTSIALNVEYPFSVRAIIIHDSATVDTNALPEPFPCSNPALPTPTDTFDIPASKITGINDRPEIQDALWIYPNPATGVISIYHPDRLRINAVEVYGIDGKRFMVQENTGQLNIEPLPPGLYYIQFHTDHGILHRKIVKE